ncbi:MAG: Uma2 family endonuclease [Candidatus Eremiobacteraeota bacterium]|nr:Uma2 family endonuclease [Candidatus Eremiobacteraeota bacterium]
MTARSDDPSTLDEFIAWGLAQETRFEFADGIVSPFPGGTLGQMELIAALLVRIRPHIRPGRIFASDALLRMERSARFPDLVVTYDERDGTRMTTVRYPKLIVEVLSDATAAVDRGEKLDEYRAIETLHEYVLIDSRVRWAQTHVRRSATVWNESLPITGGELRLASIDLTIDLDALYEECGM